MSRDLLPRDSPRGVTATPRDLRPGRDGTLALALYGCWALPPPAWDACLTACCKAPVTGPGPARTVPSGQLLVGPAPPSTPAAPAPAPAAACTSERNRFLSAPGGGVVECRHQTEPTLASHPGPGAGRWEGVCLLELYHRY